MSITHSKVSSKSDGADNTKVQPSDWNAEHEIAAGYFLPRIQTLTLTHNQIIHLPTTPIELIATPGAGKAIRPLYAHFQLDGTADYTNIAIDYSVVFLDYGNFNYAYLVGPIISGNFLGN